MSNTTIKISLEKNALMLAVSAMIAQQLATEDDFLKETIELIRRQLPPLFKKKSVENWNSDGEPLLIKCPVTKLVMRKKGDEDEPASFLSSPACLAEWDDVDLECAAMNTPELKQAWDAFLSGFPEYDGYEDLIGRFILMHYGLFEGRNLLLVITENHGGGCGGYHTTSTYSLLDTDVA